MRKLVIDEAQFEQLGQMRLSFLKAIFTDNPAEVLEEKYFYLLDDLFYQAADRYSQTFINKHY